MIKHFFFTTRLDYKSGSGTLSINYIKEFNKKDIVVICNQKNQKQKYLQYNVLHKPLDYIKNPFFILKDYFKVKRIIKRYNKYKLYSHFTVEPYALLLVLISKFFISNTFYAIGTYALELHQSYKTKFLFNFAKKFFNKITFFSSFTKSNLEEKINFKNSTVKKVINPIIYLKEKNIKSKKFKNKTILCIGEIKPRKGYHFLIKVLSELNNVYNKNYNLIIIGNLDNFAYGNKLKNLIKKFNLQKKVKILTNVNEKELSFYYKKSHIFTLLSKKHGNHFEGFGIVYLEALYYNLPIIISKESGAKDLININSNLKTFSPNNYKKIAKEIIRLTNNKNSIKPNYYRNILIKHCNINKMKLTKFYKNL